MARAGQRTGEAGEPGRATIQLLDEAVVAGIAAGEVVERPASVVKELVENSLDAGATRVTVELAPGNPGQLRVIDDGIGIAADEIELALTRHATSKLRTLDDVAGVGTFGFRGEALASIGAVAEMQILTAVRGAPGGTRVRVRSGKILELESSAAAPGTRIEIQDLFADLPARRKFLRSAAAESSMVLETMRRFALSYPRVHLRLLQGKRVMLDHPGVRDLAARTRQVLGAEVSRGMLDLDARLGGMRLRGRISPAGVSYGSARRIYLFVGTRWVRDRMFFRSVMEGYHTYLLKGRYPAATLFLDVDPHAVDVNVHPAKLEVRFSEGEAVRRFLVEAVADTLRSSASPLGRWGIDADESFRREVRTMRRGHRGDGPGTPPEASDLNRGRSGVPGESAGSGSAAGESGVGDSVGEASEGSASRVADGPSEQGYAAGEAVSEASGEAVSETFSEAVSEASGGAETPPAAEPAASSSDSPGLFSPEELDERPVPADGGPRPGLPSAAVQSDLGLHGSVEVEMLGRLEVVGQVFDGYLVCQGGGELVLVDQHAAHERMLFEKLKAQVGKSEIPVQPLLVPARVEVGVAGVESVEARTDDLKSLGWDIDVFGEDDVLVRGLPAVAAGGDAAALAEAMVADLAELGVAATGERLADRILATVACHSAVRVGQRMERRAATALLQEVARVEFHACCPHGRPVARSLTRGQVERLFGR